MSIESATVAHYASTGLLDRILEALRAAGVDPASATPEDLAPVDHFHIAGAAATREVIAPLGLGPEARVLDVGCGVGGPARLVAATTGAEVVGIDLTPDYVETATALSRLVGLGERTRFEVAAALATPFEDESFDAALLLHVGMNIPDKRALMAEAARVLKPGGVFAVYDIMAVGEGPLDFPVPWASEPEQSFHESLEAYRAAAAEAGFVEVASRDRREPALAFFAEQRARLERAGPPALGLHLLMGPRAGEKIANMVANVRAGRIAPTELRLRRS